MLRPLAIFVLAASVLAAVPALPSTALAKDGAVDAAIVSSPTAGARAELATPKLKRARRSGMRRVASVAAPAPYHPQCFLFWCNGGGHPFNWLVLGVAY